MTHQQLLAWVDKQIADYSPVDDEAGEIRNRFAQIVQARGTFAGGSVFGFTIPAELRADAEALITERLDASLAGWKEFLAKVEGGTGYYERSLVAAGLLPALPRTTTKDNAIARAATHLRTRLADTAAATDLWRARGLLDKNQHHAFAIAKPPHDIEKLLSEDSRGRQLPPLLAALYTEIAGLWVRPHATGGEQPWNDSGHCVFVSLARMLDRAGDLGADQLVLDQQAGNFSQVLLDRKTGAITTVSETEPTPVKVAGSLVEYLELLAEGYGRVLR